MTQTILWFRQDLRLADNPALHAAAATGPVLPVYILDDAAAGPHAHGGAQRWWLHHTLAALQASLRARGLELLLLQGNAVTLLTDLAARSGATTIHAARLYEPWARARDASLAAALATTGRSLTLHSGALLHEPHRIRTGQGNPYAVYTPFSRAIFARGALRAALWGLSKKPGEYDMMDVLGL
jgi:deoxyribodipyrimidine photo-lyase